MSEPRIKSAYLAGHRTARNQRRFGWRFTTDFMAGCPYSTFMPGVQCRMAWRIGYLIAYDVESPSQASRRLYAI